MLASFYSYDDASAFADTYPDADVMAYDDEMDVEYDGDDEDEE
jgi:hypothetical protein